MSDPFGSDPFADEDASATAGANADAVQDSGSPWDDEVPAQANTTTKERVIVQNTEGKVVVTLKGGGGYDAPWIVIHAEDTADALGQLSDERLRELMDRTKRAAGYFSGGGQQRQQGGQTGGQQRTQGRPAGAAQAPNGEVRHCAHGPMQYKTGTGRNGKTWQAFMCPAPRNASDKCDPEWLR